jgi:hypothetical protein
MVEQDPLVVGVAMMARVELDAAKFYEAYGAIYPEAADVLLHLASDEHHHAEWFESCKELVHHEIIDFAPGAFSLNAFREMHEYMQEKIEEAARAPLSLFLACTVGVDFEASLIERAFETLFDTDSERVQQMMHEMTVSCERHRKALTAYRATIRPPR